MCLVQTVRMRSHLPIRCTGNALIEWLVGGMAIMLTVALALEGAHWHITRHVVNIALMEAARAGSREHARPDAIRRAFLQAMLARFASPDGQARHRMETYFKKVRSLSGQPAWRIDQISPNESDFAAWHDPTAKVPAAGGRKVLRHDWGETDGMPRWLNSSTQSLARVPSRLLASSASAARMPSAPLSSSSSSALSSGGHRGHRTQAVQAARAGRSLHLSVTYLQSVITPGLASVIKWLAHYEKMPGAHASGILVIKADILMEMQSHAVQWSNGVILPQD